MVLILELQQELVNVVDTTDPVITVTGDNPATVELGATYTDAGAVAVDFGQSMMSLLLEQ